VDSELKRKMPGHDDPAGVKRFPLLKKYHDWAEAGRLRRGRCWTGRADRSAQPEKWEKASLADPGRRLRAARPKFANVGSDAIHEGIAGGRCGLSGICGGWRGHRRSSDGGDGFAFDAAFED